MKITTRSSIQKAFAQLLEQKPYNRVTVKDIAQQCGICRNTFYYHFRDIEDLFESSVEDWANRIDLDHCVLLLPLDCLRLIVDESQNHKKLIYYIMRSNYRSLFYETIKKFITAALTRYID
jgi:AcrR family transcriptional regulator